MGILKTNEHHSGKLFLKRNDTVMIMCGDDKGKVAKVISVDKEKYRVTVEGINIITKHAKPSQTNPQGGLIKKEAPIHISNVMLIDPKSGKATRVRKERVNGKATRVAAKSGEVIK